MKKLLLLVALAACVPQAALDQCTTQIKVNRNHSLNVALPVEARLIAEDCEDAFAAELYLLDGTKLPAHCVTRMVERDALPAGYSE